MILCGIVTGCASKPNVVTNAPPGPEGPADWTLLVYMAADCDLEKAALRDVREMAATGSGANHNVVVQIDRAPAGKRKSGYTDKPLLNLPRFTTTKRLLVHEGSLEELADVGETNTGDPAALAEFVAWGIETFPSEKVALVLWDHGGAVAGFGWDDTNGGKGLLVPEITKAVSDGLAAAGRSKLDVFGFDACLMGHLEIAFDLRLLSDFYVASEEVVPSHGWNYKSIVDAMQQNAAPVDFATGIVTGFEQQCRKKKTVNGCTLAVVDTAKLDAIVQAMGDLGDSLEEKTETAPTWTTVAQALATTERYGAKPGSKQKHGSLDAWHFSSLAPAGADDAAAVRAAIEGAVISNFHGAGKPNAHGLTIFIPKPAQAQKPGFTGLAFTKQPGWVPFLNAYNSFGQKDTVAPTVSAISVERRGDASFNVAATVSGEDIAEVVGYVGITQPDDTIRVVSYEVLAPGAVSFQWDGTLPRMTDGVSSSGVTLYPEGTFVDENGVTVRVMMTEARLLYDGATPAEADSDPNVEDDVVVYFEVPESGPTVLRGMYLYSESGKVGEIEPEPGDRLEPAVLGYDAKDEETWKPTGTALSLDDLSKLTLERVKAPAGPYELGIFAEDYSGNEGEDSEDITVP